MKQVIVARKDLGMSPGKLAAQVAHASVRSYEASPSSTQRAWKEQGQKKVVLQVESEGDLFRLADEAERESVPYAVIRDAGHTELESGSVTALGIGPAKEVVIDSITGHLSLYQ